MILRAWLGYQSGLTMQDCRVTEKSPDFRLRVEHGVKHHHPHQLLQKLLGTRVKRPKQETESRLENPTEECRLKKIYAIFWLA